MDLNKMTPKQLATSLMRGNKTEFQLGYSAESAALVAADRHSLDEHDRALLVAYCQGFADGCAEDSRDYNMPARESEASWDDLASYDGAHRRG